MREELDQSKGSCSTTVFYLPTIASLGDTSTRDISTKGASTAASLCLGLPACPLHEARSVSSHWKRSHPWYHRNSAYMISNPGHGDPRRAEPGSQIMTTKFHNHRSLECCIGRPSDCHSSTCSRHVSGPTPRRPPMCEHLTPRVLSAGKILVNRDHTKHCRTYASTQVRYMARSARCELSCRPSRWQKGCLGVMVPR